MRFFKVAGAVVLVLFACTAVQAAPITFFGEDLNTGETTRLASTPNADAANAAFLAALSGVGTEDFESYANNTNLPLAISFAGSSGSITATLSGSGFIQDLPGTGTSAGRYPISGTKYLQNVNAGSSGDALTITFSTAVAAFGFYGTDFGDFNGVTELKLTNGTTETVSIGNSTNIAGGAALFFGVIDTTHTFDQITFRNTNPSGGDFFGFDDMTVGDLQQVVVPVPPAAGLGFALLAGLGILRLRRRKN